MYIRWYEKLIVWKEAHQLCIPIYCATKSFPNFDRFGLVIQMRKASCSIPMNIAEGNTRRYLKDKKRFINIAEGSLEELHYQLLLARDLQYVSDVDWQALQKQVQKVGYLLHKFQSSLS